MNAHLVSKLAGMAAAIGLLATAPGAGAQSAVGGADPLTSKVAVLSPSRRADADVDYLFLQVFRQYTCREYSFSCMLEPMIRR